LIINLSVKRKIIVQVVPFQLWAGIRNCTKHSPGIRSTFKSYKACFTLGVRANVQPESSIPIGAKVEISPKTFKLGVKAEFKKKIQSAPKYY
jgi:hypothetical protein